MKRLFVVGAPKAGTTKLVDSLNQHFQIAASNPKENNFYSHEELAKKGNTYSMNAPTRTLYDLGFSFIPKLLVWHGAVDAGQWIDPK